MTRLIRIEAPHFVAGAIIRKGRVTRTAPILRYMRGWGVKRVRAYCIKKGWKYSLHD